MSEKLKTPGNFFVFASSSEPDKSKLEPVIDRIFIIEESFGWAKRKFRCGHKGPKWFRLHVYGIESKKIKNRERCPNCELERVRKHVIRCGLCKLPIFPGKGVALYNVKSDEIDLSTATIIENTKMVGVVGVIGCLRWDCCPSGGFFAGHWTEQGYRPLDVKPIP